MLIFVKIGICGWYVIYKYDCVFYLIYNVVE